MTNTKLKTNTRLSALSAAGTLELVEWVNRYAGEYLLEAAECGVTRVRFQARRPLHPQRFWALLGGGGLSQVVCSKGYLWFATRMKYALSWQQIGGGCTLEPAGYWWAALSPTEWGSNLDQDDYLAHAWDTPYGDRRQEVVLITIESDPQALLEQLTACLLTDQEFAMGRREWRSLPDPFPRWRTR